MTDLINNVSLRTSILSLFEENKDLIEGDKFINYLPTFNIEKYSESRPIAPYIPYEEVFNFLDTKKKIKIIPESKEFHVKLIDDIWRSVSTEGFQALKDEGRINKNERTVRLFDIRKDDKYIQLSIRKTSYHEQAKSNLILDYKSKSSPFTLRDLLIQKYGEKLPPLNDESLSNNVGMATLIFYKHGGRWLPYMVRRQKKMGVFPGGIHCTASGGAKWPESEELTFKNFFREHMLSEIKEEVGLLEEDIPDFERIALCREFARGGKPQMFFAAKTDLSLEELDAKREEAKSKIIQSGSRPEIIDGWRLPENANTLLDDIEEHKLTLEAAASVFYWEKYFS